MKIQTNVKAGFGDDFDFDFDFDADNSASNYADQYVEQEGGDGDTINVNASPITQTAVAVQQIDFDAMFDFDVDV